jgi:hypothetical protein
VNNNSKTSLREMLRHGQNWHICCGCDYYYLIIITTIIIIIGKSLVTTAWRILRLRMEETPSKYGEKLRIY